MRIWVIWILGALGLAAGCAGVDKREAKVQYPELEVQALLSKMTLEEKLGQMTQVTLDMLTTREASGPLRIDDEKLREVLLKYHVGSILCDEGRAQTLEDWNKLTTRIQTLAVNESRLGIPVICGIGTVYGINHIRDATVFPQPIALGASGNRQLVRRCAEATSRETRAAGISWQLSSALRLARHPLGPWFFGSYSEDMHMTSVLGREYVMGLQGRDGSDAVAACMQHFLTHEAPASEGDGKPVPLSERQLRARFLPPFAAATRAGVLTASADSSEVNGLPVLASAFCLQKLLRQELGFKGFVLCDGRDINELYVLRQIAKDQREALKLAVTAGVDMCTIGHDDGFRHHLIDLVQSGEIPVQRIDEAVGRILRVKYLLGLFDAPRRDKTPADALDRKGATELSYQAACEALTLLKNEKRVLPLSSGAKVLVTGPCADRLSVLCGGRIPNRHRREGDSEALHPAHKDSILEAIEEKLGRDHVTFVASASDKLGSPEILLQEARAADVIVACLGEAMPSGTLGNNSESNLPVAQVELVTVLAQAGKPIIGVLVQGRPYIVDEIEGKLDAIIMAYLPGQEGGRAVADVLFGMVNPSGKLPFTYPRRLAGHMCYDHTAQAAEAFNPQWEFGHGLSYTEFAYRGLRTDICDVTEGDSVKVTVEVINTGARAGKEIVYFCLTDHAASVAPAVRQLRGFAKIELEPGQSEIVSLTLDWDDFSLVASDNRRKVEPGEFTVSVGGLFQSLTVHQAPKPK